MKEDSKKHPSSDKKSDSVESINRKEEAHPVQANKGKEDASYEEQTLMDGIGTVDDEERLKSKDKTSKR